MASHRALLVIKIVKERGKTLTPAMEEAIIKAFPSRGKYKNYLRIKAPPLAESMALCAWAGLQPNHHKVGRVIPRLMLASAEGKALFDMLSDIRWPTW